MANSLGAAISVFPRNDVPRSSPAPKVRLFCFPSAGGGVQSFTRWAASLPRYVELCPFELPGRGKRLREAGPRRMRELISAIAAAISGSLDRPFAIFGHSLGALIGFELTRYLKTNVHKEPSQLFVSGSRAPHLLRTETPSYTLPDEEFQRRIARFNGTPREILEHQELMSLMLPILRADLELFETYTYRDEPRLSCPIRAFAGLQDPMVPLDDARQWNSHTSGAFSISVLPGDHFFVANSERQLISTLCEDIELVTPVRTASSPSRLRRTIGS
jgi:surfactin synthase thioesterase subunit